MCSSKKIIIISPHFPPSNLASVHRSRLFAQHLYSFGWEPIIVTVHEKYYEERLDHSLEKLINKELRIIKTKAIGIKSIRIIGDIGIRGFYQLYKAVIKLIKSEEIDFVYIPIPSHFTACIGRLVNYKTGVKYGIDYIDPWVHKWPGTERMFSKHWWSMKLGEWLEPFAVKKASVISGVAEGYYQEVFERNPKLKTSCLSIAMPYGGEKLDFEKVNQIDNATFLFTKIEGVLDFVYAGALLPQAFKPLEEIMNQMQTHREKFAGIRIHFIGSGKLANEAYSYNIKSLALKYGLWESIFFEYPNRIPYLNVLQHLAYCDGVFILGSTEPHYTPSKVYQAALAAKPIFAVLHRESTACKIIEESKVGMVLDFNGKNDLITIKNNFITKWMSFLYFEANFNANEIDYQYLEQYSAKSVTKTLADTLNSLFQEN